LACYLLLLVGEAVRTCATWKAMPHPELPHPDFPVPARSPALDEFHVQLKCVFHDLGRELQSTCDRYANEQVAKLQVPKFHASSPVPLRSSSLDSLASRFSAASGIGNDNCENPPDDIHPGLRHVQTLTTDEKGSLHDVRSGNSARAQDSQHAISDDAPVSHSSKKLSRIFARNTDARKVGGDLQGFVRGPLDIIIGVVLLLSLCCSILELQLLGKEADASLGIVAEGTPPSIISREVVDASAYVFASVYSVELLLRITVLRKSWLFDEHTGINYANVFDAVTVLGSVVELLLIETLESRTPPTLRIMIRFTRVLRIVRGSQFVRPLRILLSTTLASMGAFVWSILLLLMWQISLALVLSQLFHSWIVDEANDLDARMWMNSKFGDFFKTLYTSFELTYSGGWPNILRPVLDSAGLYYMIVLLIYVIVVNFAVVRIISALFLKETLAWAANDTQTAIEEKSEQRKRIAQHVQKLFESLDEDEDGLLKKEEMEAGLHDPLIQRFLGFLDLNVEDVKPLLKILDNGMGTLAIEEFCDRIMYLKGQARSYDVVMLLHEQHALKGGYRDLAAKLDMLGRHLGCPDIAESNALKRQGSITSYFQPRKSRLSIS